MNPAQAYRLFLRKREKGQLTHCATGSYNDVRAGSPPFSHALQSSRRPLLSALAINLQGAFICRGLFGSWLLLADSACVAALRISCSSKKNPYVGFSLPACV